MTAANPATSIRHIVPAYARCIKACVTGAFAILYHQIDFLCLQLLEKALIQGTANMPPKNTPFKMLVAQLTPRHETSSRSSPPQRPLAALREALRPDVTFPPREIAGLE